MRLPACATTGQLLVRHDVDEYDNPSITKKKLPGKMKGYKAQIPKSSGNRHIEMGQDNSNSSVDYLLAGIQMDEPKHFASVVHLSTHLLEFSSQEHVAIWIGHPHLATSMMTFQFRNMPVFVQQICNEGHCVRWGVHKSAATSGDRSALLKVALVALTGASTGAGLAAIACVSSIFLPLLGICACTDTRGRPVKGVPWAELVVVRCSARQKACAPQVCVRMDDIVVPHFCYGQCTKLSCLTTKTRRIALAFSIDQGANGHQAIHPFFTRPAGAKSAKHACISLRPPGFAMSTR